eukprot:TRINITY_DN1451_c0_g1_i2.p1 TRINITY_DN1451_c0_g1~~TRINITY_DN1451_c0_g1_i2.p1  ORF type:complete len:392 (-),score=70.69 TRINITY_DN1451_c0_g1_i2:766-1884(-)
MCIRDRYQRRVHGDAFVIGGNSLVSCEKAPLLDGKEIRWRVFPNYDHLIPNDVRGVPIAVSRLHLDTHNVWDVSEMKKTFKSLYIFGAEQLQTILRLDLETLKWSQIPKPADLQLWDYSIALTLPSGKIFICGGINAGLNNIKASANLITVQSDGSLAVEALPNMNQARYTHTLCYLADHVYVLGGRYYGNGIAGVLTHCERLNLTTRKWEVIASLRTRRCTAQATGYNNRVHVFGGYRGDGRVKSIERYNEITNVWENIQLLLHYPIEAETMLSVSGKEILLIGGKDDFAEQPYVVLYDLERQTYKLEKNMSTARILCKSAKYKDTMIIVGGDKNFTCEKAKIGEWNWTSFPSYSNLLANNLQKTAYAQSF